MNKIARAVFRAIHEGKWLQIEYKNRSEKTTRYWIGIRNLNPREKSLAVDAMHMVQGSLDCYEKIFIESIKSADVIDGSYQEKNERLIRDIQYNAENYEAIFGNVANLKILNYLAECNRLDTTPYCTEFSLLRLFDADALNGQVMVEGNYALSQEQF